MGIARHATFLLLTGMLLEQSGAAQYERLGLSKPRMNRSRRHSILRFGQTPAPIDFALARNLGFVFLHYIPNSSFVVSAPEGMSLTGTQFSVPLLWSGEIEKIDKISGEVDITVLAKSWVLVEFHPDVDMDQARSIVLQAGMTIQENPDLLDHDLLVNGTGQQVGALADWDEVAYIYPAADELVQGLPMTGCDGALTEVGQVGQQIAIVGGWGGTGNTGTDLQYAFVNTPSQLPEDSAKSEVVRAFTEWARHVKLTFTETGDLQASRSISILFGSGNHGDAYPFTSTAAVAHTFYPYPLNLEPIAGDMHFNADESWHSGADIDLFSVALHETGHALGLGHSDQPGAVMYPYYRRVTQLAPEDVRAILALYPAADGTPAVTPPLSLTVGTPAGFTTADTVSLSGTAAGGSGAVTVTWASANGSGLASGSPNWTIAGIPLALGTNTITVTATDSQQATASQTVTVTRTQQPPVPTPPTIPSITLTSPTVQGSYSTSLPTLTAAGTAADTGGVTKVSWLTSQGQSGTAQGTSNWTAAAIPLSPGTATLQFTAWAASGKTASVILQVVYTPDTTPPVTAPPVTPSVPPPAGAAPTLRIDNPSMTSVSTSSSTISMSGTCQVSTSPLSITWATSNGDSGTANGSTAWSIAAVPVYIGSTTVIVTATDGAGRTAWRSLVVTRR